MNGLERLGVALVGAAGQSFESAQIVGQALDDVIVARTGLSDRACRLFGRLAGGFEHCGVVVGDDAFEPFQPRRDVLEFGRHARWGLDRVGKARDLSFEALHQFRIDRDQCRRGRFQPLRDAAEALFEAVGEDGEPFVHGSHQRLARLPGLNGLQLFGERAEAQIQFGEELLALGRAGHAAFVHGLREGRKAAFDALEDFGQVRRGRDRIDLAGDRVHLFGQARHRLVRHRRARGDLVDPLAHRGDLRADVCGRAILDQFVDLLGQRADPRFDALERLAVDDEAAPGAGRSCDGA